MPWLSRLRRIGLGLCGPAGIHIEMQLCWCPGENCVYHCQAQKIFGPGNHHWKFCCRKVQTKGTNWWTQDRTKPICKVCYEARAAATSEGSGLAAADATGAEAAGPLMELQNTVSEIGDNYCSVGWVTANFVSKGERDVAIANLQGQIEVLRSTVKDLQAWVEADRPARA